MSDDERKYRNALNQGAVNAIAPKVSTPFSRLAAARSDVESLVGRLEARVAELVGDAPQEGAVENRVQPSGLLGEVYEHAEVISDITSRAHRALDRLVEIMGNG